MSGTANAGYAYDCEGENARRGYRSAFKEVRAVLWSNFEEVSIKKA
jgi:hypothetical protein